jgi:hypothetical protein
MYTHVSKCKNDKIKLQEGLVHVNLFYFIHLMNLELKFKIKLYSALNIQYISGKMDLLL